MTNRFTISNQESGGRVLVLFLLFFLALYQFYSAGFNSFAIICLLPLLVPVIYVTFTWQMLVFWALFVINYFVQWFGKNQWLPGGIPTSMYNELLEILLIGIAIVDTRKTPCFDRALNLMLLSVLCWCAFCTLEVLNDTCDLGINVGNWYTGARMMAFQLLYAVIVYTLYINNTERLNKYIMIWAILSLFTVFWTWKQINIGMTPRENAWMQSVGRTTHILNGGTLIRYFSTHNDAANYGVNAAATAIFFIVVGITTSLKRYRIFYLVSAVLIVWGMFQSGTRTAIFCMAVGFMVFLVLSKSVKIMVPSAIFGGLFFAMLMFTDIGNGNQQIRRMRSAFDKKDASSNVRAINQEAIRKYIKDAPWGIGLAANYQNVPANNKYKKLSTIPPDSEYVYIWVHTGPIGITFFLITTAVMFLGACSVVFFRIKSRSLMGVGAGFCGAFAAVQLGGYGNQVLMQYPNCLLFYGGLAIVYTLPYIEPEWVEHEKKLLAEQEERKRIKLEKKQASRV